MSFGIIYKATNVVNGKVYIGQTVQGLNARKRGHLNEALHGDGSYSTVFHNAILKYKPENFKWEVIAECSSQEELNQAEIGAIFINKSFGEHQDQFDTKFGYNMTLGGAGFSHGETHPMKKEKNRIAKRLFWENVRKNNISFLTDSGREKRRTAKDKICIYKLVNNKFIEKHIPPKYLSGFLSLGWTHGRTPKISERMSITNKKVNYTKDRIWMHKVFNNIITRKRVLEKDVTLLLEDGWLIGNGLTMISDETLQLIIADRKSGMGSTTLARKYNVSINTIKYIYKKYNLGKKGVNLNE